VQPSRKSITAFAVVGDFDTSRLRSNLFELEWPPKSGTMRSFPEVDRAEWFTEARAKILPGQRPFIDRLLERLGERV
jgi:predicted NUDIX family NTP pyrophosphohydrolase